MAARHSWAVQQVSGVGQMTVEDARLSMSALWTPAGAITSRSGMVPSGVAAAPGSVLATGTPNGFVHVQPFRYVMQSIRGGGTYVQCLDAIFDLNILGTQAADPTNARIDLIIAQQNDVYFSDANSDLLIRQVVGTPSGSPVDPTVTGSTDYVLLARVTVPANATTITTGNIANVALPVAVATGAILPVADATARGAIANPYDGMTIYRRDFDWYETWDGAAWRIPTLARTAALANITNPATGQLAILTTDNNIYRWTGAAWIPVLATGATAKFYSNSAQSLTNNTNVKLQFSQTIQANTGIVTAGGTNNDTFTAVLPGSYEVEVGARSTAAGGVLEMAVYTPGNVAFAVGNVQLPGGSGGRSGSVSGTLVLAAGDTFAVNVFNSGTTGTVDTTWTKATHISIRYVGP